MTDPVPTQTRQVLMEHCSCILEGCGGLTGPGPAFRFPVSVSSSLAPLHTHTPCETPNLSTASLGAALPCGSLVHPSSPSSRVKTSVLLPWMLLARGLSSPTTHPCRAGHWDHHRQEMST